MGMSLSEEIEALANEFEKLTDSQAQSIRTYFYEWEPPWFFETDWFLQGKELEEFGGRVMDTLYALRRAVEVLRADPELVERIAKALHEWDIDAAMSWSGQPEGDRRYYRQGARAVLALITTDGEVREVIEPGN